MYPFQRGFCGNEAGVGAAVGDDVGTEAIGVEVGAGAIACGRHFSYAIDNTSHLSYASQRQVFGCSADKNDVMVALLYSFCFVYIVLFFVSFEHIFDGVFAVLLWKDYDASGTDMALLCFVLC